MADIEFDWSGYYAGMGRILRGSEMQSYIAGQGAKKAAQMNAAGGSDYASRIHNSGQRWISNVYPINRGKRGKK